MQINRRVSGLKPSPTLALNQKAKALQATGKSVINLTVGEPDLPTPDRICKAAIAAIERRETRYTASTGIVELKDAILNVTQKNYGRTYDHNEVMVSAGAKQVFYNICAAVLNEGDEVIIPAPYWVSYLEMVKLAGGNPIVLNTEENESFIPQVSNLEGLITKKTRLLFLNSPSNPTGGIYPRSVFAAIAKMIQNHPQVVVVTDDIYERFLFDGKTFDSIGHLKEVSKDQLIIVNGVSKTYAMTGWRIGYVLAPKALISAMDVIQSNSTSNPASISQWAAVEALTGDQKDVNEMRDIFEKRRNRFHSVLISIPKITCVKPMGAFYFFSNVSAYIPTKTPGGNIIANDVDLAEFLLLECGVATVPGSSFGAEGFLRISYAASKTEIEEGLKRLHKGLISLRS